MKKSLFTLAIVLLALAAQAQTAIKVHDNGQISLQSATTMYGIQIPADGVLSIEPNVTTAYGLTSQTKTLNILAKALVVKQTGFVQLPVTNSFYVLGNGDVYAYGSYLNISLPSAKGSHPIEGASEMVAMMKGYYLDTDEFAGVTPEEIEGCENIIPEAVEGLLFDMEKGRTVGMVAEELESILPEAVRHDPDGLVGINYNAVVAVLIEAFKEQQARIDQLESILRGNGLLEGGK